jgi:hypothetical protein
VVNGPVRSPPDDGANQWLDMSQKTSHRGNAGDFGSRSLASVFLRLGIGGVIVAVAKLL